MKITRSNNELRLEIKENFDSMLGYLYLCCLEFISNGLFVPSLNLPSDGEYKPNKSFFNTKHFLTYNKSVIFVAEENGIITLTFDSIEDAEFFKEDLERTW